MARCINPRLVTAGLLAALGVVGCGKPAAQSDAPASDAKPHAAASDKAAAGELLSTPDLPMRRLREPPLPVLAAILLEAAAYLGGDTGVSHLAAAVGSPAVILFPPASRPRWTPWSPTALPLTMPDPAGTIAPVVQALIERVSGALAVG